MAMTKQPLTITRPTPDRVTLNIGPHGFTFPVRELFKYKEGWKDHEHLLFQIHLVLEAAGVDPRTATAAQIKTAVEAATYWWEN